MAWQVSPILVPLIAEVKNEIPGSAPEYSKQDVTPEGHATKQWAIRVREPGRDWILCGGMYEWVADQLLERLRRQHGGWDHP